MGASGLPVSTGAKSNETSEAEPPLDGGEPPPTENAGFALSESSPPLQASAFEPPPIPDPNQLCFGFVRALPDASQWQPSLQPPDAAPAVPDRRSSYRPLRAPAGEIAADRRAVEKESTMNPSASVSSKPMPSEDNEPPSNDPPPAPAAGGPLGVLNSFSEPQRRGPVPGGFWEGGSLPFSGIPVELDAQRRVASDPSRDIADRLEAYEDIIDSEVGDTTLARARNIEREVGLRQIYLKFEGANPTGTQKDRIAFAQCQDALRRGFDAITAATCGNYGAAVALAASAAGLGCVIFIPESYHTRRTQELTRYGARIVRVPGDYEAAVLASRKLAEEQEIYDANPGGANTQLQLRAYGGIAYEIYDELRDAPAVVAVPVSNGTTLGGIYRGFLSLYRRGKTSRMPRMVAGSSYGKNPIIQAFVKSSDRCDDLRPERIRETPVNEPLINWHAIDGDIALDAIRSTGGFANYASDKNMIAFSRFILEREALSVLPASTAGLSVLLERHRREPFPGDRYVVVLTGKRS
jgi:threonine synthase